MTNNKPIDPTVRERPIEIFFHSTVLQDQPCHLCGEPFGREPLYCVEVGEQREPFWIHPDCALAFCLRLLEAALKVRPEQ